MAKHDDSMKYIYGKHDDSMCKFMANATIHLTVYFVDGKHDDFHEKYLASTMISMENIIRQTRLFR